MRTRHPEHAQTAISAEKAAGNTRITRKQSEIINDRIQHGGTYVATAERVGVTTVYLTRVLKKPHIQAEIARRKEEVFHRVMDDRAFSAAAAMEMAIELARSAESEVVRLQAVKFVASVGGFSPVQRLDVHQSGSVEHTHKLVGYEYSLGESEEFIELEAEQTANLGRE